MTINIAKVTKNSTETEIIDAIINLSKKERSRACKICTSSNCKDCLTQWYCARNSAIRILRNIFELPLNKDVPKAIFHLASEEADNILYDYHSRGLKLGINKCKMLDCYGKLKESVPPNEICLSCGKEVPPSRNGYVINGDPVCWECEVARSSAVEKRMDMVVGE